MPIYLFLDGTGCVSIHTIELRWLNANTCNGLAGGFSAFFWASAQAGEQCVGRQGTLERAEALNAKRRQA